jgi:sulfite reductase alpha subunit-like flavoprotein
MPRCMSMLTLHFVWRTKPETSGSATSAGVAKCYAQDVAERLEREAKARHYAARAVAMNAYDIRQLPQEQAVIFVASTTGQVGSSICGRVSACIHKSGEQRRHMLDSWAT